MLIFFFFKQKTAYEMRISDLEFRRVLFRSYALRGSLAALLHLDADTVHVAHVPGAGCYGHNGADDAALDAALVARAIPGRPVLLKWSRADEHAWEPYGSCMAMDLRASLDADGAVIAWSQETYKIGRAHVELQSLMRISYAVFCLIK